MVMPVFTLAHLSDPHLPMPAARAGELLNKRATGYLNWWRNRVHLHVPEANGEILAHSGGGVSPVLFVPSSCNALRQPPLRGVGNGNAGVWPSATADSVKLGLCPLPILAQVDPAVYALSVRSQTSTITRNVAAPALLHPTRQLANVIGPPFLG